MTIFLLGTKDPEMDTIQELLREQQQHIQLATLNGARVHPGNAYKADPVTKLMSDEQLVCIECRPRSIPTGARLKIIGHHRQDEPGWDKGPDQYWEGSSIGQVCQLLNLPPTNDAREIAAMDHCFAAAVLGKCPGVKPRAVLDRKVAFIAGTYRQDIGLVWRIIDTYRQLLRGNTRTVTIGKVKVIDMTQQNLGVGYSIDLLCLQAAAAVFDSPVLLCGRDTSDGPTKITLYNANAATVNAFMRSWGPTNGLEEIYGVPSRGDAGGYFIA